MRHRAALAAATAIATVGIAASAPAVPTISTDRACYTSEMPQLLTGSGFTPDGEVRLTFTILEPGGFSGSFTTDADATGALDQGMRTPRLELAGTRAGAAILAEDMTLQSQGAPPEQFAVAIGLTVSDFDLTVSRWSDSTSRAKPGRRTRVEAVGWVGSSTTTLFAHYLRGRRLAKTVRIGALTGDCGDLTARMREFPFKPVKRGAYRVVFDTTRKYPNEDSWVEYTRVLVSRRNAVPARVAWDPRMRLRPAAAFGLPEYR